MSELCVVVFKKKDLEKVLLPSFFKGERAEEFGHSFLWSKTGMPLVVIHTLFPSASYNLNKTLFAIRIKTRKARLSGKVPLKYFLKE